MRHYAIGLDFGSLSARGILADVSDGTVSAQEVCDYPHGVMSERLPDGTAIPPAWALQDPADYLTALDSIVPSILRQSGARPEEIIGIGVDFTTSTVLAVDRSNTPLCFLPEYSGRLHAYAKLWKHHGAQKEADQIQAAAEACGADFLESCGGTVSPESMFAKILQTYHEDPELYRAADHFVEAGDWLCSLLAGSEIRSASIAACKIMWKPDGGYPGRGFLVSLEPGLVGLEKKLTGSAGAPVYAYPGQKAGTLSETMAERLGLRPGIAVTAPQMDAYAAMPGVGITEPGKLMLMAGTSTAILLMSREKKPVPGVCACVQDSILPGFACYAAGQASVGDCFRWFLDNCVPASYTKAAEEKGQSLYRCLAALASRLAPGESGLVALDWWNGNKSCLVNAELSGLILGMTLETKPEHIYRALLEATAFGADTIIRNFEEHGVPVDSVTACGGIAGKDAFLMQMYADVFEKPVSVNRCGQTAALGSAVYAASAAGKAAGGYDSPAEAARAMADPAVTVYLPDGFRSEAYRKLKAEYLRLHDYFGRGGNDVMKRLRRFC